MCKKRVSILPENLELKLRQTREMRKSDAGSGATSGRHVGGPGRGRTPPGHWCGLPWEARRGKTLLRVGALYRGLRKEKITGATAEAAREQSLSH